MSSPDPDGPYGPWVEFHPSVPDTLRESVTTLLERTGLTLFDVDERPGSHGILVTTEVNEWAFGRLHALHHLAAVLVIVIAPARRTPDDQHWRLMHAGAADVLAWSTLPDNAEQVRARFTRMATVHRMCDAAQVTETLIGSSAAWRSLVHQVVEFAMFTNAPVLITGESGTGKELVARLIHSLDPRPGKGDLVVVDCTTITPELSGSEFFGHERGAFTGALNSREGAFALAHSGTLFLDEVGDLPLPLQAQLLRAVQEGKYKRVGGNAWQDTRFRLVSATHCDLQARVAEGRFRADLYFRIAGAVCHTPPLRERRDDVLALARYFQSTIDGCDAGTGFDESVCRYLLEREYPGNVRELKRVVERLCMRHAGNGPITIGDVPESERPPGASSPRATLQACFDAAAREAVDLGMGLKEIGQLAADCAIAAALDKEHGNLHRAAARLDVTDRALQLRRAQQRPPS